MIAAVGVTQVPGVHHATCALYLKNLLSSLGRHLSLVMIHTGVSDSVRIALPFIYT